ncbi:MAG: DUF1993 domain-containing protein [Rhodobacteraceae bacterium]|nr:DUF1993 domain-containing protein [Paracoccaceae bacterium]
MFAQSVPVFSHFLAALSGVLAKAEAHCEAQGIKPEALLTFRLYPDMFPLTKQVQLATDFATRAADRLTGREIRGFADTETSFAELRARIDSAREYLGGFTSAEFDGAATRVIKITLRSGDMQMAGSAFLETYAKPQFFFHMTTAYDILRHNGVVLGKRNFMGAA